MAGHTVKAYDRELDALGGAVADMGESARRMVVDAVEALISGDIARAHEVAPAARRLDALRRRTEYDTVLTIARRAPVADDLRGVVAVHSHLGRPRPGREPRRVDRQSRHQDGLCGAHSARASWA